MNNILKKGDSLSKYTKFLIFSTILSSLTVMLYYLVIEPLIIRKIIGVDIDMIWGAISGEISEIYKTFGYIYPPHFWYQFFIFRFSYEMLIIFMVLSQIFFFPLGLHLILKKFNLKHPQILMWVIYPAFVMDVIVRNLNVFIFLIIAFIIYYYEEKPFLAGLLFLFISFKITTVLILLILIIRIENKTRIKFLLGFFLSLLISFIFFPISGISLYDYWNIVTNSGETFDLALSISRLIRFNHMIWVSPLIFSIIYAFFLKRNSITSEDIPTNYKLKKKYFSIAIIVSILSEIILGLIGLIAYISYIQ